MAVVQWSETGLEFNLSPSQEVDGFVNFLGITKESDKWEQGMEDDDLDEDYDFLNDLSDFYLKAIKNKDSTCTCGHKNNKHCVSTLPKKRYCYLCEDCNSFILEG